jgi:hypothetical protein
MNTPPRDTRPKSREAYSPTRLLGKFAPKRTLTTGAETDGLNFDAAPQIAAFNEALGQALSVWQLVESALFEVFLRVSTAKNSQVAAAIFYAARDVSVKRSMTNAAVAFAVKESPAFEQWKGLDTRLGSANSKRNNLAHFQRVAIYPTEPGENPKVVLCANWQNPSLYLQDPATEPAVYDASALADVTAEYLSVATDINAFAVKLETLGLTRPQ